MSGTAAADRAEWEQEQARVDIAMQAGWTIRWDPDRLEYRAAKELHTARSVGELLDKIGVSR